MKVLLDLIVKIKKYDILNFSPSNLMIPSLNIIELDIVGQELQNELMWSENPIENGGEIRVTKPGVFLGFRVFYFHFFSTVSHSTFMIDGMILKPLISSIHWYKEQ